MYVFIMIIQWFLENRGPSSAPRIHMFGTPPVKNWQNRCINIYAPIGRLQKGYQWVETTVLLGGQAGKSRCFPIRFHMKHISSSYGKHYLHLPPDGAINIIQTYRIRLEKSVLNWWLINDSRTSKEIFSIEKFTRGFLHFGLERIILTNIHFEIVSLKAPVSHIEYFLTLDYL